MSKKCKSEAKKRRLSQKRSRKAAEKAKYDAWKTLGQNTKSKRVKLRAKARRKTAIRSRRHSTGPCGNVGCKLCNPAPYNLVSPAHRHTTVQ